MRRQGLNGQQGWQWRASAAAMLAAGLALATATPANAARSAASAPGDPAALLAVALPPASGAAETDAAPAPAPAIPAATAAKPGHTPRAPLLPRPDEAQFAALDWNAVLIGGGAGLVPSFEGSGDTVLQPIGGFNGGVGGISVAGRGNRVMIDFNQGAPSTGFSLHAGAAINQNFARANLEALDPRVRL
ncbi:MAG: hypothetical protein ACRCSO_03000, partial [Sphingomonas sp.]